MELQRVEHDWATNTKSFCFLQSCVSSIIKSCCPSKSDSLGTSSPLLEPKFESLMWGHRTFTTVGGLLWYYCSPVCGLPTRYVWDLILTWLCQSYCLIGACPLNLDVGYLFLVGSNTPLLMIVQHLVVILVFSQEKMSTCPYGELDKIKIKTRDSRR